MKKSLPFDLVKPGQTTSELGPTALCERQVPDVLHDLCAGASTFHIDEDLAEAVNVALSVGAPLLLTGEPGTGKTQLAYFLVWYFGIERSESSHQWRQPFVFHVKSNSAARDVLYTFDTVAYFHEAQRREGESIDKSRFVRRGPLWSAVDAINGGGAAVLLIDEIDKAPRDFPNDLLRELDQYNFDIPETDQTIRRSQASAPPVVVITSNSEKRLPEAFLRRCIFHHIILSDETLRHAVRARRESGGLSRLDPPTIEAAHSQFLRLRSQSLQKKPGTAEYLAWLSALDAHGVKLSQLEGRPLSALPFLSALIKDTDDRRQLG